MPVVSLDELNLLHYNICRALGDPKRIQILYALCDQPCPVIDLAKSLDSPQSTVSRHLSVLRQSGLVSAEREGTSMIYRLTETHIIEVLDSMRQLLRTILANQSGSLE